MQEKQVSARRGVRRGALEHHLDRIEAAGDILAMLVEAEPDDPRAPAFQLALGALLTDAKRLRDLIKSPAR